MAAYLEEAAALLRRSLDEYEKAYPDARRRAEARERIAGEFAKLAAIEGGLIPAEWVGDIIRNAIRSEQR